MSFKVPTYTASQEAIIRYLEQIRERLRLVEENPFHARAYEKAISTLSARSDLLERLEAGTLTELPGIGKGIEATVLDFLRGNTSRRDELDQQIPEGLMELLQVPGLGPAKARVLVDELGIRTLGELEYACRENRLVHLKGFGEKVQEKILHGVHFLQTTHGKIRLGDAVEALERIRLILSRSISDRVEETGALRRRLEVLDGLDFIVESEAPTDSKKKSLQQAIETQIQTECSLKTKVRLHFANKKEFAYEWARTTASSEHWKNLIQKAGDEKLVESLRHSGSEEALYQKLNLPCPAPEMREGTDELASDFKIDAVVSSDDIQGVFHCHTLASDGAHSVEEMIEAALRIGYRYIGISDHSQSAHYARGLKKEDLDRQEKEIQRLQKKHSKIRIFWGIESDILKDGSLDYPEEELRRFDFVIASIHSRFSMNRDEMTRRMLEAVKNPATRMIGHLTGRLLLGRAAYELDIEAVIREAARRDVAIELNAHPARLDVDWRWGTLMREVGCRTSINPDAHSVDGLTDTVYGVWMARKALLPAARVINASSVGEVEQWLKKSRRQIQK